MKKLFLILTLFLSFTSFAGSDVTLPSEDFKNFSLQQNGIHRHVPSLYTYACAQLPPEEEVVAARPTLPPSIMGPAYQFKQLLTETSEPWQWHRRTFKDDNHFWYTIRKIRENEFPALACFVESENCSRSFIDHAQKPNNNALLAAAYWGRIDDAKKHLEAGANIHSEDDGALSLAAMQGHTFCVAFLLGRGADLHANKEDALLKAIQAGNEETARFLLDQGADRTVGGDPANALYYSAQAGLTSLVMHLINLEIDKQEARNSALTIAAEYGHKETVEMLINNHADIHNEDDEPFRKACEHGQTELAQLLLSHGANMHAVHDDAFVSAAENGHVETVQFLLNQGEFPFIKKNHALIDAVKGSKEVNDATRYIATLEVLLDAGADIHAYSDSALRNAIHNGDDTIIAFLLAHGASKDVAAQAEYQREKRLLREQEAKDAAAYKIGRCA